MIKKEVKAKDKQVKVTFVLAEEEVSSKVSVVGDFNEWDPSATELKKRSNGTYSATVKLEKGGEYAFRYYFEDGTWKNDESADEVVMNPFGTANSLILT